MALTVRELITKLETLNPDLPVATECERSSTAAHVIHDVRARRSVTLDETQGAIVVLTIDDDYVSIEYGS